VSPGVEPSDQRLVLVIGPGRSGTSTIAGALTRVGLEVPGRAIRGNDTNPSGFYEPRWVVDFHKSLLQSSQVENLDSSPSAIHRTANAADKDDVQDTLREWLGQRLAEQPRLVVKDPRTVWFRDLWVGVARDLGVEPGFVTMLRHPAEVSASRQKYYATSGRGDRRIDDVSRIAGWVNVALTAEQVTQGSPRGFVRYTDLLEDWRRVLRRLQESVSLEFVPPLDEDPHPVDDFIDPTLRRVRVDWSDVGVPAGLRDVAERAWQGLGVLCDGESTEAIRAVELARQEFAQLTEDALAISRHEIRRLQADARRRGRRAARKELAQQVPVESRRGGWMRLPFGGTR
jgi:hypothetical protein